MNKKANVATPSPSVAAAEAKRALSRALMGGTDEMIRQGSVYLSPHPGEMTGGVVNANYIHRLNANILTNFLELAIEKQVGKIFSKPITLEKNVPADIAVMLENIDLQGRNMDAFAMDVVKQGFVDGISYIMVDYPKTEGIQTLADEKKQGVRPYAIHVKPCCLLEVLSEQINGVETLTRIRIKECHNKPDAEGFGYHEVEQVRVLRRDPSGAILYELWQENEKSTADDKWELIDQGTTTLPRITLIPVYVNRTGFYMGLPPNQSTAWLNLRHWRSTSEQIWATTFGRFGMLAGTGIQAEDMTGVGPGKKLTASDPAAKFYIVEPTGKGVEMGRLDLESIEAAIESAPVNMRVENAGKITATAAMLDSAESNAGLKAIAQGIKDSVEQMLMAFAEMMGKGKDAGGEVLVNDDFTGRHGSDAGLQSLDKALAIGGISTEGYQQIMVWRGEYPADWDIAADMERAASEAPALSVAQPA